MKKVISFLASIVLLYCMAVPAFAENNENVISFDDGSYIVVTLQEHNLTRSTTPEVSRIYTYYNPQDEAQWAALLRASFYYNGTTSEAISAKGGYHIYNSEWSYEDSNIYCDGSDAVLEATFAKAGDSVSITIVLHCDKNGNIS